ncbi:MAG: MFS transporter [Actinobacteria bacterium]|nr:MFS transporter [Actinomycetota bacterium]
MADRVVSPRRLTALISSLIFLDMITWLAAIPLIPYWQRELGLSDDQAGVVLAIYSLTVLILAIPSGHIADRLGARRLTLIGAALFVVAAPLIAFADSFEALLAVRVFQGACSAITWSAGLAWLAASVGPEYRMRGLSIANASATIATIAGPLFGGPIVAFAGIEVAFLGLAVLVVAVIAWALVEPGGNAGPQAHEDRQGPFVALIAARRPGALQVAFVSIAFVSLMMAALQLLAPLHYDDGGWSSSAIGWVFTAGSVLSVLAIVIVGRLGSRIDGIRSLVLLPVGCAVVVAALLVPLGLWWYSAALVIVIGIAAPVFTISYAVCAEGARAGGIGEGSAFGMLNAVWAVGAVISPVISGIVAEGGVSWVAYVVVAVLAIATAVFLAGARRRMAAAA